MAITVTTGAPISGLPDIILPEARSFSDLYKEISDEIDDTTGEYNEQIQRAIFHAIRFCEREPYYFNETLKESFFTVAGQWIYGGWNNRNIASAAGIAALYFHDGSTVIELSKVAPDEIEILNRENTSAGRPVIYTYFGKEIRLYPPPDKEYKITMRLEPVRFDRIQTVDETNPWFYDAYNLIRARAKYELYRNVIKDQEMAQLAYQDWNEEDISLKAETSRRNGTGIIRGTYF